MQPPEDHWEDGKHSTFRPQSNVEDTTARLRTALTLLGTIMKENFSKNKTVVPAMSLASTLLTTTTQPQERWNTLGDMYVVLLDIVICAEANKKADTFGSWVD